MFHPIGLLSYCVYVVREPGSGYDLVGVYRDHVDALLHRDRINESCVNVDVLPEYQFCLLFGRSRNGRIPDDVEMYVNFSLIAFDRLAAVGIWSKKEDADAATCHVTHVGPHVFREVEGIIAKNLNL